MSNLNITDKRTSKDLNSRTSKDNKEKKRMSNKKWISKNPNYNRDYKRKYKLEHPEKIKEQDRRFREKHKNDAIGLKRKKQKRDWARTIKKSQIYSKENKARCKANYHIKIPKGQKCERCKKRLAKERHHADYNKPLEVEFVCRKCHKEIKDE